MARTPPEVLDELLDLAQPGWVFPTDPESVFGQFLEPLASEFASIEALSDALLVETDPGEADYLLTDYEQMLGADPAGRDSVALSRADRRRLALQRWTGRGGQSIGFFIGLAAAMGVTVIITEFPLSVCGETVCGDVLTPSPQQFAWLVTLPTTVVEDFTAGASVAGDLLGSFVPSDVEAVIRYFAPAHTQPYFSYTG